MNIISQALTTLGLSARATFLLLAAVLWTICVPSIQSLYLTYSSIALLPLHIVDRVGQGAMPAGNSNALAINHLSQTRILSGLWSCICSIFTIYAHLCITSFLLILLALFLIMTFLYQLSIVLDPWTSEFLLRGFQDWGVVRAIVVERMQHFVLSVMEFLIDLSYEYLQDEWRQDATPTQTPSCGLFTTLDFLREHVRGWLISPASSIFNFFRSLGLQVSQAIDACVQPVLKSPGIPSFIQIPLSALVAITVMTGKVIQACGNIVTQQASNLISKAHNTEQESKRKMNQTIYEPLSPPNKMIRILRILPGIQGQALHCFVHAEERSSAKFEAVSYVWGEPTLRHFIILNGTRYYIGKNLYECLVHLRSTTKERELWVDTLCINQADFKERSQQVLLMGDLFKRAERVVVWLGLDIEGVADLLNQAREDPETDSDEAELARVRPHHWRRSNAIQYLLSNPWWSRVWTVQELVLGSFTILQCGKYCSTWGSFCRTVDQSARVMNPSDLGRTFHSQYLALKRERLLYRQHVARRYPLLERVYIFRMKKASLAVDKLFGFYGLLEDPSAEIRPNYVRGSDTVAKSFAMNFINRYKSLAVIAIAELSTPDDKKVAHWGWYPLWERDGTSSSKTLFWTGLGDEIGGQAWSENSFNAVEGRVVRVKCRNFALSHYRGEAIRLEGWHRDTVALTSEAMTSQDLDDSKWNEILAQWLSMACGPNGATDGDVRQTQRSHLFYKTITAGLFDDKKPPTSPQYAKYLEAVRQVCRWRRLFLTSSGRYGVGPQETTRGDEIWVLLGMAVPAVLSRRVAFDANKSGSYRRESIIPDEPFRYVGQAYIDELVRPGNISDSGSGLSEKALETACIWSNLEAGDSPVKIREKIKGGKGD